MVDNLTYPHISAQAFLSGMALATLAILSLVLAFVPVPQSNHDFLVFILGSLGGAITITGGSKVADKLTQATGANPVIQPDSEK